jgi:hypothetical protein
MKESYLKKVAMYRLMLLALVVLCYFLYEQDLTGYVILISIFILFFGIFAISDVEVTSRNVSIRKNYFRGLVGFKWVIDFEKITSITFKEYEIETHEDAWMFAESLFSLLAIDLLRPKVNWLTSKLSYLDKGIEKGIELKMNRGDYREIYRRIQHSA